MENLSQVKVGNNVNLPKREQLNIFAHEGEGILKRIQNELGDYNRWGTLEYSTAIHAIGKYISDVNLKVVSVMRYHWNGEKRELII